MSEVEVDIYLTDTDGFVLREQFPFTHLQIGKLEPGEERCVHFTLPCVPGNRRVTAIVSGMGGKHRFVDTRYLLLSPLLITKLCTSTSPEGEIENPFAYAELYNPLCVSVPLEEYSLCARILEGDHRRNSEILVPLEGGEIPPHGRAVVWSRPEGCTLTVEDFNARYGTDLQKGRELLIAEQPFLVDDRAGHFVDLCFGKEHLCRAEWGCYYGGAAAVTDQCDYYRASHDITLREGRFVPEVQTPIGVVSEEQHLVVMAPDALPQAQESAPTEQAVTKLTKAPLHPLQAAAFLANAFSTFKSLFSEKE